MESRKDLSPGVMSLLPMFYVGWADSVLSPSEFSMIHQKIGELDFLDQEEKDLLIQWTNPSSPPDPQMFRFWIQQMKKRKPKLSPLEKQTLVDMGLILAKSSTQSADQAQWTSPQTKQALLDIQEALGVSTQEGLDLFLHKMDEEHPHLLDEDTIDPKTIQAIFDETYTETRGRMRTLLRDPFFKLQHVRNKEEYREWVLEMAKALAQQGFGSYAFPKEYGGQGDSGSHITVFEMLGYHDLSLAVKFGVQFGLFGSAIYNLGTKFHHEKYLRDLGKADLLGCFAMTETGHGSNVKGLETTLTYDKDRDEIIVHTPHRDAGKEYIGNALHSTHAVVFGQLVVGEEQHGIHAVVVRIRDEEHKELTGIRVEDNGYKMGLNGIDNGRLWFTNVSVPRTQLLNRYGSIHPSGEYVSDIKNPSKRFFTMLSALVAGRVSVGLASVSAAKKALHIGLSYSLKRRQFASKINEEETLILDYPSHQHRLFPLLAKTYALDFAMKDLTEGYIQSLDSGDRREVETLAAGLKAMASWHATKTIQECRESCGGKGYLIGYHFADLKADSDIFTTFEGDNTVLLQLVAKGLLSNMQKLFHDEGYIAVMRYVSQKMSHTLSEYNVYFTRRTDLEHLLDPDFYQQAFKYRVEKLLDTVSSRMKKYIGKRIHPSDAFLRCQNHMIALAKAHIDYQVLKAFYRRLQYEMPNSTKQGLTRLYQLYALTTIETHKGFYLENDFMTGNKTKAIRRVIHKLCSEIRPHAKEYIDAFGIPDALTRIREPEEDN